MWQNLGKSQARRLHTARLVGMCVLFWHSAGFAQAANSAAAAEALFSQARSLLSAGKFAEACPKFAESQRLDPGTGTLMNLADCYERADLLASAWTSWLEAARSAKAAGQTDREGHARKAAAALEPRLARLTLQVQADPPPGLSIKRNGIELAQATWGTPLPVDKGRYRIEVSAPEYRTAVVEATVDNGQTHNLIVPRLVRTDSAPTAPPVVAAAPPRVAAAEAKTPPPQQTLPEDRPESPGKTQRVLGTLTLSLGGAGLAAGGVLGILALSKFGQSKELCLPTNIDLCSPEGVRLREQALGFGDASTVAFSVGGALAAGGLILWLTAPRARSEVALLPSPGGLSLHVGGRF